MQPSGAMILECTRMPLVVNSFTIYTLIPPLNFDPLDNTLLGIFEPVKVKRATLTCWSSARFEFLSVKVQRLVYHARILSAFGSL